GTRRETAIVARPIVSLHRILEPVSDLERLRTTRQVGDEEAELITAEPRVEIAGFAAPLDRQEVLGSDLVRQNLGDALDDAVPGRVPEGVVVPLEASDIDD